MTSWIRRGLTGRIRLPTLDERQHAPMRILPDRPQLLALLFVFGKDHLPTAVFLRDGLGEFLSLFHRLRVALKLEKDGVLVREFQCQALRWGCCLSAWHECLWVARQLTP
jgi:hypothetical protein